MYLRMVTWQKSANRSSFATAFPNAVDDWSADGCIKSNDDVCTSNINLVGFCPVTQELTPLNCAQQASISTLVGLSTFPRGQCCYDEQATW